MQPRGSVLRHIVRRVDWIPVGDRWCRLSIMGTDLSPEALQREPRTAPLRSSSPISGSSEEPLPPSTKKRLSTISLGGARLEAPESPDNRVVILMIPGNPGNEGFYTDFGERLLKNLMSRDERTGTAERIYLFYTISHLNHVKLPPELEKPDSLMKCNDRFLLNEQIQHKLDFVREYLPHAGRVYLLGHSIGSYMMLRLLPYIVDDFNIKRAVGLFPTVERMAVSPNGIRLRRVLAALSANDWLAKGLSCWLDCLPVGMKKWLVGWNLRGNEIPACVVDSAAELLAMNVFRNIVHMSHDEMESVTEFDKSLLAHKDLVYFLYGTVDGWAPLDYGMEMVERMPSGHVIIDDKDCEHAFVMRDGKVVAEKLVPLIV